MRCSDIFPATATMERCRTDGSRSPDCASFPAHHSWGLVFARQSGARSRQVLENGSDSVVEETTRQVLPTAAAREAIAALPKHHVEPGPLLRRAGISEHVLRSPKATQNTEFILGCFRTAFRALTGRNATPTTVAFSHNRNSDLRECVGSSRMTTLGSRGMLLAMTTFCWFPPESVPTHWSAVPLIRRRVIPRWAKTWVRPLVIQPEGATRG